MGFGSSTGLDPITQGLDASTQGYAPYFGGYYGHYYGKRDADADPALLYAGYAGYPYAAAYGAFPHAVAATTAGLVHFPMLVSAPTTSELLFLAKLFNQV